LIAPLSLNTADTKKDSMNDRIGQQATDLDQYSNSVEREIQRYERLYDLYLHANPHIAIMLAASLDALYASRRKVRKE
jgi:hypothetical protein